MAKQQYTLHGPSSTGKIVILAGFCLLAYMLYALTLSIYKNYQIDRHISNFESQNQKLEQENAKKIEDYQYFTSRNYIEKVAKQSLGLINPNEKIIIIPEEDFNTILETEEQSQRLIEEELKTPNIKKWWQFFFINNPFK